MDDLGRAEQPEHRIPVGRMCDIAREQPHRLRQADYSMFTVHLWKQDVHHSDVVTGLDKTVRECRPDESRSTGDEDGG